MSFLKSYADKSTSYHFLAFGIVAMVCFFLFSFFGVVAAILVYDLNLLNNPNFTSQISGPKVVNALRLIQLFNAAGLFIVPPIVYSILFGYKPLKFFKLNSKFSLKSTFMVLAIMIVALPLINWMAVANSSMHLPGFLADLESWMRRSEESAKILTEALLNMETYGVLAANLIVVAIIPAIGEELFFRGGLQQIMQKGTKNHHLAIWITAYIFSALHMQFLGFFPRMFLGALFGYLFYWSGSLWLPIIGHFLNNGLAVLVAFMIQREKIDTTVETVGANSGDITFVISSGLLLGFVVYSFYKNSNSSRVES